MLPAACLAAIAEIAMSAAELPQPEAVLVAPENMLKAEVSAPQGVTATGEVVEVDGQPFRRATRVCVATASPNFWDVQLIVRNVAPIARGDTLHVSFAARCVEPAEGDNGQVTVYVQKSGPPWDKMLLRTVNVGRAWQRFDFPFRADQACASGKAELCFGFAHGRQVLEIADARCANYGRAVEPDALPRTRATYPGRADDAPWRAEAERRIERHRKADLAVTVVDAEGRPVPGAEVRVRQTRHAFRFGTTVAVPLLYEDTPDSRRYRAALIELFNHLSTENALKWPPWSGERGGRWNRQKTLEVLQWMHRSGFRVHGHVLVWPSWRWLPESVGKLKDDPDALRAAVAARIRDTAGATRGLLDEWDVVNEPFNNHDLMDVLGREVMIDWFRMAREADPDARLYINDFGILASGNRTDTPHQAHYEETIQFLLAGGAPLEGIGLQSHFTDPLTAPPKLWTILDRFARFGLPMQVTEFDIDTDDEQLQADYTRDFMTAVFAHPGVNGFVMWGFWEGRHWRPRGAMFRRDWTPKPNAEVYRDLVFNRWWTDEQRTTDARGRATVRAFHGTHAVRVEHDGREVTGRAEFSADGAELRLVFP